MTYHAAINALNEADLVMSQVKGLTAEEHKSLLTQFDVLKSRLDIAIETTDKCHDVAVAKNKRTPAVDRSQWGPVVHRLIKKLDKNEYEFLKSILIKDGPISLFNLHESIYGPGHKENWWGLLVNLRNFLRTKGDIEISLHGGSQQTSIKDVFALRKLDREKVRAVLQEDYYKKLSNYIG